MRTLVRVLVILAWLVLPHALAQDVLRFWAIFNEDSSASPVPQPAGLVDSWSVRGIDLPRPGNAPGEVSAYFSEVQHQTVLLRLLAAFRETRPGFPRIEVRF